MCQTMRNAESATSFQLCKHNNHLPVNRKERKRVRTERNDGIFVGKFTFATVAPSRPSSVHRVLIQHCSSLDNRIWRESIYSHDDFRPSQLVQPSPKKWSDETDENGITLDVFTICTYLCQIVSSHAFASFVSLPFSKCQRNNGIGQ